MQTPLCLKAFATQPPEVVAEIEQRARRLKLQRLFVLTTRTSGWFVERGFVESEPSRLPKQKRDLYNWQRRSLVYEKAMA